MSKAPAVDYALAILEFFSQAQGEVGIADISNALNINKNAVSRVLEAFLEQQWIYLSDERQRKYRLTLKPFSLIAKGTPQYALAEMAAPEVRELNRILKDAVYFGVRNGENVLYLLHQDSQHEVRVNGRVGGEYPLERSAPGKVLLAYGAHEAAFDAAAAEIQKQGYALDNEEFAKGVLCLACPVYGREGKVAAAVGLTSLTLYDTPDSLIREKLPLLLAAAERISRRLGFAAGKGEQA